MKEDPSSHDIEYGWVARDERRIRDLAADADELLFELGVRRWEARSQGILNQPSEEAPSFEPDEAEPDSDDFDEFFADLRGFDTEDVAPSPPSSVSLRDSRTWSRGESAELLRLYREGMGIHELSRTFTVVASGVVRELSAWLLITDGELVNEDALKFGQTWSTHDLNRLRESYQPSACIRDLGDSLGRDQLGVAFKLFEHRIPQASDRLIARLETRGQ